MKKIDPVALIKKDQIGVISTDTIFGLVGSALSKKTVERIYKARKRNPKKPLIILIGSVDELQKFGIKEIPQNELAKIWPGKVSIIFESLNKKFSYLDRGTKSLAFRLPKNKSLLALLQKTGPLVAPSANPEGKTPAKNISEAKKYFGDGVDFYIMGKTNKSASTILKYNSTKKGFEIIREGAVSTNRLSQKVLII